MRPHHDTPAPERPGAITTAQTATPPPSSTHMPSPNAIFFEANIEAIVEAIAQANDQLRDKSVREVVEWAIAKADGRAIVSTNFRPYEAVILHLVT